jgi:enhancing lycopene biosynthesis protein 2
MKIGVILSGCGVYDGSEIQEAVITMLCLDQAGVEYQCMAPNKEFDVIDHLTGIPSETKRNVLVESARIARDEIVDLSKVKAIDYDGFILPGGFGAAKNLSTFATEGGKCKVEINVARVLREAHKLHKPIGFACIAPVIASALFGPKGVNVTIGKDKATATKIISTGATHTACMTEKVVVDVKNRIVSTPAYMTAGSIKEVYAGISKMVTEVVKLANAERTFVVPAEPGKAAKMVKIIKRGTEPA